MTDLAEVVPLLEGNLEQFLASPGANRKEGNAIELSVKALEWGNSEQVMDLLNSGQSFISPTWHVSHLRLSINTLEVRPHPSLRSHILPLALSTAAAYPSFPHICHIRTAGTAASRLQLQSEELDQGDSFLGSVRYVPSSVSFPQR